jgi:hypothetical protein
MGRHPVNADKVVCMFEEGCNAFFEQANRARTLLVRFPPSERKYGFNLRFWQVGIKTGLTV